MDRDAGWKAFVQRNRTYLVQNVDFKETELWDAVQSAAVISNIQVQSIKSNNNANFRQVGAFVDHLLKRGKHDYDGFVYALQQTGQDHIAQHLIQGGGAPLAIPNYPVPGYHPRASAFPQSRPSPSYYEHRHHEAPYEQCHNIHARDAQPSENFEVLSVPLPSHPREIMKVEREAKHARCNTQPKSSTKEFYDLKCRDDQCYLVKNETRGRVIIITMTGDREGWKADVKHMAELFNFLEFNIQFEFDVTEKQFEDKLEDFAQSPNNAQVDCVWVVIMGHGDQHNNLDYLVSKDGHPIYLKKMMERIFNNKICSNLTEKPKGFIVQMCRGDQEDNGVPVPAVSRTQGDAVKSMRLGTFTDYVYGFATQEGKKALRDTVHGSWYIKILKEVFLENAHFMPVLQMLQEVNRRVGDMESEEGLVQTAEATFALRKDYYLFPGVSATL